jgi:uncharacterized protein (TIGR02246 family)
MWCAISVIQGGRLSNYWSISNSMKRVYAVTLKVVISVAVAGLEVMSNAQTPATRAEEEEIRAVISAITEAFNKHDAKAWTRLATPDAQLITVRGESMNGVAEIEKGLTAIFQTRNSNAILKTLEVRVKLIRPDVALAHVTSELSGVLGPDGQKLPAHRELSQRVFVKDQGVWRITAFHNTMLQ